MIKSQNTQEKAVLSKDTAQSRTGSDCYHNPVSTDNKSVDNLYKVSIYILGLITLFGSPMCMHDHL